MSTGNFGLRDINLGSLSIILLGSTAGSTQGIYRRLVLTGYVRRGMMSVSRGCYHGDRGGIFIISLFFFLVKWGEGMKINVAELVSAVESSNNKTLTAAYWYIDHGIPVLPATDDGKLPSKAQMPGVSYQSAAITKDRAKMWFDQGGAFYGWNLSVPTGGNSGICVVDIDNKKGKSGSSNWAELEAAYGELPESTLRAFTPSGGVHLFFRSTEGFICGADNIAHGVDSRGHRKGKPEVDAGHVLVYPSSKQSGQYTFDDSTSMIASPPAWIVELIQSVRPLPADIELPDEIPEGGRDDFLYKFGLRLAARGFTDDEIRTQMELAGTRLNPPDPRMVAEKIASVLSSDIAKKREDLAALDLQVSAKGTPIKNATNLLKIVRSSMFKASFSYKYDEFKKRVIINGIKMDGDLHVMPMVCFIENEFQLSYTNTSGPLSIIETIIHAAMKYEAFDSYKDYLNSTPRPSSPHPSSPVFEQFADLMGLVGLTRRYLRCSLLAMVGRGLDAGCKVDTIPVLCGAQGAGKSSLVQALLPERDWFSDELSPDIIRGGASAKDAVMKLDGKAVVEAQEMTAFKFRGSYGHETSSIKQFVTTTIDEYRTPYGRTIKEYPRRFVLWGTTNANDFLIDTTGNRRYFPIPLTIDIKPAVTFVRENRDLLWGEMVDAYKNGERWVLNLEEQELQQHANTDFMKHDVWTETVLNAVSHVSRFTSEDVLVNVLGMMLKDINNGHKERVNNILRGSEQFLFKNTIKYTDERGHQKTFRGHVNVDKTIDEKFKATRWTMLSKDF